MRIFLVEDESRVRKFLEEALRREGHTVEAVETYESADDFLKVHTQEVDVVILDRLLNGKDGMNLVRPFRQEFPLCRIIILSAIKTAEEKAAALDMGADDYLSKPFSLVELSARLRAVARRSVNVGNSASQMLALKDIALDPISRIVTVKEKKMDLSNKEFQLLALFVRHPGRVYNKFELLDTVWDTQFDIESNVVEVTIKNLRRKLEASKSDVVISTKRNVGYWIEA